MEKRRSLLLGPEDQLAKPAAAKAETLPAEVPKEFFADDLPVPPMGVPIAAAAPLGYLTVLAFVKLCNLSVPAADLSGHGKAMAGYCRQHMIAVQKVADPRWGAVNAYPVSALRQYFGIK